MLDKFGLLRFGLFCLLHTCPDGRVGVWIYLRLQPSQLGQIDINVNIKISFVIIDNKSHVCG